MHVKTPRALGKLEDRSKQMIFILYERGTKGYRSFNPTTHKVHLSRDVIFEEGCKWNFVERQLSEGMELHVSGVNLGFENPSERMEEVANIEGVLQDLPSNGEAGQSEGWTSINNEEMPRYQFLHALYEVTDLIEESFIWLKDLPLIPSLSRRSMEENYGGGN